MDPEQSVSSTFDSVVESIDAGEDFVLRFLQQAGIEESERYFVGLAVREVLANAIQHGNRYDPAKKAAVRLWTNASGLTIEVDDEGEGFRLEDVADPRASENRERRSGRGLAMVRGIMDKLHVEKLAPRGTRVRMVKQVATTTAIPYPDAGD